MKLKFELKKQEKKNGEQLIYLISSYGYKNENDKHQRFRFSTKKTIHPNDWDCVKQRPKDNYNMKDKNYLFTYLNDLQELFSNTYKDYLKEHEEIKPSPEQLRTILKSQLQKNKIEFKTASKNTKEFLSDFITEKIEELRDTNRAEKTIDNYVWFLNAFLAFEDELKYKVRNDSITEKEVYKAFFKFVNTRHKNNPKNKESKDLKQNGFKGFKRNFDFFLHALIEDYKIEIGFNIANSQICKDKQNYWVVADKRPLKLSEIEKIYFADLRTYNEPCNITRDMFIVGCFTGLRFSDLAQLHNCTITESIIDEELEEERTVKHISSFRIAKTNTRCFIPVLPIVQEIYDKYNGFPEIPCLESFNRYLKRIATFIGFDKEIEIDEFFKDDVIKTKMIKQTDLITSHIARISFVSIFGKLVGYDIVENFTHPTDKRKAGKRTVLQYDKTNDLEKCELFYMYLENNLNIVKLTKETAFFLNRKSLYKNELLTEKSVA